MDTTTTSVVLAAPIKEIGDHLFTMFTDWGEKALLLVILLAVVMAVASKMSVKAGIGALIGLVICYGLYESRAELSKAFKDEIVSVSNSSQTPDPSSSK
ncbi:hypothetical protein [Streptomyces sp. NPDC056144]|uniref:hypothetical protein n=1 Tax=unclassified Streptomyces TaxID=2593676 RepID=UPI0035DEDD43